MLQHDELIRLLKQQAKHVGSQKQYARQLGISPQYLSDVIKGRRMPNDQILKVLGLAYVPCYRKVYHRENPAADEQREKN